MEKRDASDRVFDNVVYDLKKKHALGEEGCFREGVRQIWIGVEQETCFGRGIQYCKLGDTEHPILVLLEATTWIP